MFRRRNNGFTLIELLVVIAIIAILAAILFPVFAQAKVAAKKAAAISQTKQTATAALLYTGDADDMAPNGATPDLSSAVERYKYTVFTNQTPAGWFSYPGFQDEHALTWANTTEPYRKNYDLLNLPGTKPVNLVWPVPTTPQLKEPKGSNLTFNGSLQHWSMTAIAAPSKLPLFWQGTGNITRVGSSMTNPTLNCNGTGPCRFNPGGLPQPDATGSQGNFFKIFLNGESNYYVYGQTILFVAADSSIKTVPVGLGNQGPAAEAQKRLFPINFVQPNGTVTVNAIRGKYVNATVFYTAAFMPDNEF